MKDIFRFIVLSVFIIVQIIWIPIGLLGIALSIISNFIEETHMQICNFIEYITHKYNLED